MESKNELEEIGNKNCTCYYLDEVIETEDFHVYNILTVAS